MSNRKTTWKLVSELGKGEHATHTGAFQKQLRDGRVVVLPTRTANLDRGCRFIHFGNHSFIPSKGEVIFGLNDIVEVATR